MKRTLLPARPLARLACGAAGGLLAALLAAMPAHAQLGGIMGHAMSTDASGGIGSAKGPNIRQAAPPALPGARSTQETVAPPQRLPTDMQPTDALFDAINRGDIAAAREAIGRGANLRAHNILGLTPIDLSVDLSRTDITFLLLSMRGAAQSPSASDANAGARTATGGRAAPPPPPARAARPMTAPRPSVAMRQVPRPSVLASESPGTPRPSVGFLGFGTP